jgi:hypothetical protein
MNAAGADVPLRILPVWVRRALGMVAPIFRELGAMGLL